MTRNTTGGKGHKSQRSEDPKAAKNRRLADLWVSDMGNTFPTGTLLGRVLKKLGNGRVELFAQDEHKKIHDSLNVPLRGGMTGRAKRSCWVDVGSVVLVSSTGLAGTPYEIFAVLEPGQIATLKKMNTLDERFFIPMDAGEVPQDDGYEFDAEDDDVNVDEI